MPRGSASKRMTPETLEKIRVTLEEKKQNRKTGITVGKYRIYRFDTDNVAIDNGIDENNREYYPDFPSATLALFRRLSDPKRSGDVNTLLASMKEAEVSILKAIKEVGIQ